jgi:hypothetical protein
LPGPLAQSAAGSPALGLNSSRGVSQLSALEAGQLYQPKRRGRPPNANGTTSKAYQSLKKYRARKNMEVRALHRVWDSICHLQSKFL